MPKNWLLTYKLLISITEASGRRNKIFALSDAVCYSQGHSFETLLIWKSRTYAARVVASSISLYICLSMIVASHSRVVSEQSLAWIKLVNEFLDRRHSEVTLKEGGVCFTVIWSKICKCTWYQKVIRDSIRWIYETKDFTNQKERWMPFILLGSQQRHTRNVELISIEMLCEHVCHHVWVWVCVECVWIECEWARQMSKPSENRVPEWR